MTAGALGGGSEREREANLFNDFHLVGSLASSIWMEASSEILFTATFYGDDEQRIKTHLGEEGMKHAVQRIFILSSVDCEFNFIQLSATTSEVCSKIISV